MSAATKSNPLVHCFIPENNVSKKSKLFFPLHISVYPSKEAILIVIVHRKFATSNFRPIFQNVVKIVFFVLICCPLHNIVGALIDVDSVEKKGYKDCFDFFSSDVSSSTQHAISFLKTGS